MGNTPTLTALALLLLSGPWLPAAPGVEPAPPAAVTIGVPGGIVATAVVGDHLLALVGGNELRRIDLRERKASKVVRFPEGQTPWTLGVAGGEACVAATDRKGGTHIHLIDLAGGRITASVERGKANVQGIGFVAEDLLFIVGRTSVTVLRPSTGKAVHEVEVKGGLLRGHHRVGDLLYVARAYAGGLAVIDLKRGKLLEVIAANDWLGQVQVIGDAAFVWGEFAGLGRIDLKAKRYATLKQPEPGRAGQRLGTLHAGPGAEVFVLGKEGAIHRYDGKGRLAASTAGTVKGAVTLAGVWGGRAVLTGKEGVTLVPLEPR